MKLSPLIAILVLATSIKSAVIPNKENERSNYDQNLNQSNEHTDLVSAVENEGKGEDILNLNIFEVHSNDISNNEIGEKDEHMLDLNVFDVYNIENEEKDEKHLNSNIAIQIVTNSQDGIEVFEIVNDDMSTLVKRKGSSGGRGGFF